MRHSPYLALASPFFSGFILFYKNISSCVLYNVFATGHFPVHRGVRQGDPLPPYLFIIVLEVLTIRIRGDKSLQGSTVDGEEIKLEIFADDITGFLKIERSFSRFLDKTEEFGERSGLRNNYEKTRYSFLGIQN